MTETVANHCQRQGQQALGNKEVSQDRGIEKNRKDQRRTGKAKRVEHGSRTGEERKAPEFRDDCLQVAHLQRRSPANSLIPGAAGNENGQQQGRAADGDNASDDRPVLGRAQDEPRGNDGEGAKQCLDRIADAKGAEETMGGTPILKEKKEAAAQVADRPKPQERGEPRHIGPALDGGSHGQHQERRRQGARSNEQQADAHQRKALFRALRHDNGQMVSAGGDDQEKTYDVGVSAQVAIVAGRIEAGYDRNCQQGDELRAGHAG